MKEILLGLILFVPTSFVPCVPVQAVKYIQITTMHLDDGEETHEAFRIREDGHIEWATWTNHGVLLELGETQEPNPERFVRALDAQNTLHPLRVGKSTPHWNVRPSG